LGGTLPRGLFSPPGSFRRYLALVTTPLLNP
jgi:hypothetical protein